MTRHSEPSSSQNPGVVSILQLSTESLNRLCDALELAGFLPKASGSVNKAANKAHLLDNVQHPKASKLIVFSPEGPQLDLTVFTVKELKCLAASLPVSLRGAGNKEAIVGKITDGIAGEPFLCKIWHPICGNQKHAASITRVSAAIAWPDWVQTSQQLITTSSCGMVKARLAHRLEPHSQIKQQAAPQPGGLQLERGSRLLQEWSYLQLSRAPTSQQLLVHIPLLLTPIFCAHPKLVQYQVLTGNIMPTIVISALCHLRTPFGCHLNQSSKRACIHIAMVQP